MTFDETVALIKCQEIVNSGGTTEELLTYLRRQGASPTKSIKLLSKARSIPPSEAKDLMHNSETWADMWQLHEEFHDRVIEELEALDEE